MNDFELNNQYDLQDSDGGAHANDENKPAAAVAEEVKPKKINRNTYKAESLVEEQNGINALFKTFTMHNETIDNLRGKGHEASDLNKIINVYKTWHLIHQPKLEYYYFTERVRKFGTDGKEVVPYLGKLRNHYKGTEMLEEFEHVFEEVKLDENEQASKDLIASLGQQ